MEDCVAGIELELPKEGIGRGKEEGEGIKESISDKESMIEM